MDLLSCKIELNYNKLFRFLTIFIILFFIIILAGANTNNADLLSSYWEFRDITSVRQGEWLNWIIISFFKNFNFSFEYYHLSLYLIGYILIFITFKKNLYISVVALIAYMIFPFTIDFIQTPNFCAMALLIVACGFLARRENKIDRLLALIFIILSGGMHTIGYLFLPIVFLPKKLDYKKLFNIGIFLIVLFFGISILDKIFNFVPRFFYFVDDERISNYFLSTTNYGFIIYWFIIVLLFFTMYYICKEMKNEFNDSNGYKFCLVVFSLIVYLVIFMPLICRSGTIFRLLRNSIILAYFSWMFFLKNKHTYLPKFILSFLPIIIAVFCFFVFNGEEIKMYVYEIFTSNWILNPNAKKIY